VDGKHGGVAMRMGKNGFTLVEIMIVVVIIGLLSVICIPYIMGAYAKAQENAMARNVSDINKSKAQLTLPVGTVGGEGYVDSTVVDDAVKEKINVLLRIGSADELAVGGMTPDYGATIGEPAKYTGVPK
jgi:prepilin-type N-terminal cleavage/methylation domain-containing protein